MGKDEYYTLLRRYDESNEFVKLENAKPLQLHIKGFEEEDLDLFYYKNREGNFVIVEGRNEGVKWKN